MSYISYCMLYLCCVSHIITGMKLVVSDDRRPEFRIPAQYTSIDYLSFNSIDELRQWRGALWQETALHRYARNNDVHSIRRVLEEKLSDVDICAKDGLTPLEWAVRDGSVDAARFLLVRGADIRKVVYETAATLPHTLWVYDYLCQKGHLNELIRNQITKLCAFTCYPPWRNVWTTIFTPIAARKLYDLVSGAENPPNVAGLVMYNLARFHNTRLMNGLLKSFPESAGWLDSYGNTMLHYAAMFRSRELIAMLVAHNNVEKGKANIHRKTYKMLLQAYTTFYQNSARDKELLQKTYEQRHPPLFSDECEPDASQEHETK